MLFATELQNKNNTTPV